MYSHFDYLKVLHLLKRLVSYYESESDEASNKKIEIHFFNFEEDEDEEIYEKAEDEPCYPSCFDDPHNLILLELNVFKEEAGDEDEPIVTFRMKESICTVVGLAGSDKIEKDFEDWR